MLSLSRHTPLKENLTRVVIRIMSSGLDGQVDGKASEKDG